jgi:hypothetical protein
MSSGKLMTVEAVTLKIVDLIQTEVRAVISGPTQTDLNPTPVFGSCGCPSSVIGCAGRTPTTEEIDLPLAVAP